MLTTASRYMLATIIKDANARLKLSLRAKLSYNPGDGDVVHEIAPGDTLWNLAVQYFQGVPYAATLWWAIADYQPEPILDPTITLTPGDLIVIPSPILVQDALAGVLDEEEASF